VLLFSSNKALRYLLCLSVRRQVIEQFKQLLFLLLANPAADAKADYKTICLGGGFAKFYWVSCHSHAVAQLRHMQHCLGGDANGFDALSSCHN